MQLRVARVGGKFKASIGFGKGLVLHYYSREEFMKAIDEIDKIQKQMRHE